MVPTPTNENTVELAIQEKSIPKKENELSK